MPSVVTSAGLHVTVADWRHLLLQTDGASNISLPDGQPADTLSEWVLANTLAPNILDDDTTRAMGLVPVNAPTVTSVVGLEPDHNSEFVVSRITNH